MREIAQEKHISMTKLSQRSEVNYGTVKNIFRNPYSEVYVSTVSRLAEVLGVPASALLEEVSDEQAEEELEQIKAKKERPLR